MQRENGSQQHTAADCESVRFQQSRVKKSENHKKGSYHDGRSLQKPDLFDGESTNAARCNLRAKKIWQGITNAAS